MRKLFRQIIDYLSLYLSDIKSMLRTDPIEGLCYTLWKLSDFHISVCIPDEVGAHYNELDDSVDSIALIESIFIPEESERNKGIGSSWLQQLIDSVGSKCLIQATIPEPPKGSEQQYQSWLNFYGSNGFIISKACCDPTSTVVYFAGNEAGQRLSISLESPDILESE